MTRARTAMPTVACLDDQCAHYRSVFHHVRHSEQFTQLIFGMQAATKHKSLPRLAKAVQGIPRRRTTSRSRPSGHSRNCARCGCG
jgi:hypothetical protein